MLKYENKNFLNLITVVIVAVAMVMGCISEESKKQTQEWREKELKAQKTRADLVKRSDEFAKFTAPEKPAQEPYVKAPVVIVWTWADGTTQIKEENITRIKDHAQAAEDAKSVFKIKCFEVPAGEYVFKDEDKKSVPAFTTRCETELFDKTIPALIHRKAFEGLKLDDSIKAGRFTGKVPDKVVAPYPEKEIEDFIYFIPRK